jgi:DNA-binding NtrC family response regulator
VNEDLREIAYYRAILQKLGCKVRASSSFAEGVRRLGCEAFDLIMVDQGSGEFEGQKVLAEAMDVDVELRVLVLARSYNNACYLEAMRSGALDYLEGPLSAGDIVALLDTFMPRRTGGRSALLDHFKGAKPSKERGDFRKPADGDTRCSTTMPHRTGSRPIPKACRTAETRVIQP